MKASRKNEKVDFFEVENVNQVHDLLSWIASFHDSNEDQWQSIRSASGDRSRLYLLPNKEVLGGTVVIRDQRGNYDVMPWDAFESEYNRELPCPRECPMTYQVFDSEGALKICEPSELCKKGGFVATIKWDNHIEMKCLNGQAKQWSDDPKNSNGTSQKIHTVKDATTKDLSGVSRWDYKKPLVFSSTIIHKLYDMAEMAQFLGSFNVQLEVDQKTLESIYGELRAYFGPIDEHLDYIPGESCKFKLSGVSFLFVVPKAATSGGKIDINVAEDGSGIAWSFWPFYRGETMVKYQWGPIEIMARTRDIAGKKLPERPPFSTNVPGVTVSGLTSMGRSVTFNSSPWNWRNDCNEHGQTLIQVQDVLISVPRNRINPLNRSTGG